MPNNDRGLYEEQHQPDKHQHSHQPVLPNCGSNHYSDCSITHVDVFLGSLTFTAEQLSFSLAEKAKAHGAVVTIQSLDEFQPEQYIASSSSRRVAVFVVSTHAAGKPSANAEKFLHWLRKASSPFCSATNGPPQLQVNRNGSTMRRLTAGALVPARKPSTINDPSPRKRQIGELVPTRPHSQDTRPNLRLNWRAPFGRPTSSNIVNTTEERLRGFQYAVFGIGNSTYRTCNATATYIDTRLQELGAVSVCPLGLGDVSKSVETMFENWETHLLQLIHKSVNTPATCTQFSPEGSSRVLPVHKETTSTTIDKPRNDLLVKDGPTLADLELSLARERQRRHSSATMILGRRAKFELDTL